MKIFVWILAAVLGITVVILGLVYFLPGYDLYAVRSDSMKPVFSSGDMVVTAPPGGLIGGEIQAGSIVTYGVGDNKVTHRVFSIDDNYVITKGDANEDPDSKPIQVSEIRGVYIFKVPYIGYLNVFVRTKIGWFVLVILPALLLAGLLIKDIIKEVLILSKTRKGKAGALKL